MPCTRTCSIRLKMYGLRAWRNRDPVSSGRSGAETAVSHSPMGFEHTEDSFAFIRRQRGQVNFLFPGTILTAHGFFVLHLCPCSFLALRENIYPQVDSGLPALTSRSSCTTASPALTSLTPSNPLTVIVREGCGSASPITIPLGSICTRSVGLITVTVR
jgi:hypothetical protein